MVSKLTVFGILGILLFSISLLAGCINPFNPVVEYAKIGRNETFLVVVHESSWNFSEFPRKSSGAMVKIFVNNSLIATNYTNENGTAIFEKITGYIRVEVSKKGYATENKSFDVDEVLGLMFFTLKPPIDKLLAEGSMDGINRLCADVNISKSGYLVMIKFKTINDTYWRHIIYSIDCPDAININSGCSTDKCSGEGRYCEIISANGTVNTNMNPILNLNLKIGVHRICIWPSSPEGYEWFGYIYGED